ncbi:glycosyltransferase family 2 protein [candidate division WOR-3 bacterium]|nr:glycosyltransferase family 2 protein [candidate division WOR-3 bacterium]
MLLNILKMSPKENTNLSIIIVNYNTEEELFQCLLSIFRSSIKVNYEIILIDNASHRDSLDKIKNRFNIRIVHNIRNVGFARAVNQGIYRSEGEYILLLNPDTKVEDNTIQTLLDFMKNKKEAGCVAPAITYPDGNPQPSVRSFPTFLKVFCGRQSLFTRLFPNNPITRSYLLTDLDHTKQQEVDWVMGACIMTRKSTLEEIGLLDEKFFLFVEDADLCYRLKEHGYKVFYIPEVKVIHLFGASTNKLPQRSLFSHNVGMFKFFEKHYNPNFLLQHLLFFSLALRVLYILTFHMIKEQLKEMGFSH